MSYLIGYKIFNPGLINRYGTKFELGRVYSVDTNIREIAYGINGYGFHFTKRLEDGLRYFNAMDGVVEIANVSSFGELKEYYDDYYGYYDLYVTSSIMINNILTREEILNYMMSTNNTFRIIRFISLYKLNSDEISLIINKFNTEDVMNAIYYYQYNDRDIYTKRLEKNL